ncbi:ABC-2 transporter permease [candidate division KSB1 bacterium]|nr:ABC-2 transporter permease [candidate division KSB1 bacterium]
MNFKLVFKDIYAHSDIIFLRCILPMLFCTFLLTIRFYPWGVYFMMSCMVMASAASFYTFREKKQNIEVLNASLPVTTVEIITARYFTAWIVAAIGGILLYVNVYISGFVYQNPLVLFSQINTWYILFATVYFLSLFFALYLPGVFWFRLLGSVINFIFAIITAIWLTVMVFRPYMQVPDRMDAGLVVEQYIVPVGIALLLLLLSGLLSFMLLKNREV